MNNSSYIWHGATMAVGHTELYTATLTINCNKLMELEGNLRDHCHVPGCEYNTRDHRDDPMQCCPQVFNKICNRILWSIADEIAHVCEEMWDHKPFEKHPDVNSIAIQITRGRVTAEGFEFPEIKNLFELIRTIWFAAEGSNEFNDGVGYSLRYDLKMLAIICSLANFPE